MYIKPAFFFCDTMLTEKQQQQKGNKNLKSEKSILLGEEH